MLDKTKDNNSKIHTLTVMLEIKYCRHIWCDAVAEWNKQKLEVFIVTRRLRKVTKQNNTVLR